MKVKKRKLKRKHEDNSTTSDVITDKTDKTVVKEIPKKKKQKDKSDINKSIEPMTDDSSPHKKHKKSNETFHKKKKKLKVEQTNLQPVSHSPGFSPPAGIVHESLMNSGKKKNKKR